jgi:L-Ala-D/L-Glu epimerase
LPISRITWSVLSAPVSGADMSIGTFAALDHVLVKVSASNGPTGGGEATVLPEFTGETRSDIETALAAIASRLIGADPGDIEGVHSIIDRTASSCRSARAAVDVACHDLVARERGLPVWRLLGPRLRGEIECTWILGLNSDSTTVDEARRRQAEGFRTFKIKIGGDDSRDVQRVGLLRSALGPDALIRVDANGAYQPERALSVLGKMLPYELEMVEQPCPAPELAAMRRLRHELGVSVLIDESVFSVEDAERVLEAEAADALNLKIQKLGGMAATSRVAELARRAGLRCVIGSCLEIGVGVAASAHFGITCAGAEAASDLAAGIQLGVGRLPSGIVQAIGGTGPSVHEPSGDGLGVQV